MYVGNSARERHFKFGTQVQHAYYKLSVKWVWLRHMTHFKFGGPHPYPKNG